MTRHQSAIHTAVSPIGVGAMTINKNLAMPGHSWMVFPRSRVINLFSKMLTK